MTHGMNYTGTIVQLGLAGTTANLVYTSIATYTYIKKASYYSKKWDDVGVAAAFGVCTPICLAIPYFIFAGLAKISMNKLKSHIETKFGKEIRIVI